MTSPSFPVGGKSSNHWAATSRSVVVGERDSGGSQPLASSSRSARRWVSGRSRVGLLLGSIQKDAHMRRCLLLARTGVPRPYADHVAYLR